MRLLDLTLPTPAENLALDEALLDEAEAAGGPLECLRLWRSPQPIVVLGRSSRADVEVRGEVCQREGVPVLRRTSGGAAVVAGPGCLLYALVLSCRLRGELRQIDRAHETVLDRLVEALRPRVPQLCRQGISDLAVRRGERHLKVSGNSLRLKRDHLLYHGTLLYDFPLSLVGRLLAMPPRQPEYRQGRHHDHFLANLPVSEGEIRAALTAIWHADEPWADWPRQRTADLVATRYGRSEWNR